MYIIKIFQKFKCAIINHYLCLSCQDLTAFNNFLDPQHFCWDFQKPSKMWMKLRNGNYGHIAIQH